MLTDTESYAVHVSSINEASPDRLSVNSQSLSLGFGNSSVIKKPRLGACSRNDICEVCSGCDHVVPVLFVSVTMIVVVVTFHMSVLLKQFLCMPKREIY